MQVLEKIKKYNQQQILRYKDELTDKEYDELLKQVDDTDFSYLDELGKEKQEQSINISPLEVLTIDKINTNKAIYEQAGTNALKNGEVGVLMLAGGMGTRLGSDLPKGMYNIGKTRDLYIFECVFNNLKNITEKLNIKIPFFIMTSELNDYPTRKFLKEKNILVMIKIISAFLFKIWHLVLILTEKYSWQKKIRLRHLQMVMVVGLTPF